MSNNDELFWKGYQVTDLISIFLLFLPRHKRGGFCLHATLGYTASLVKPLFIRTIDHDLHSFLPIYYFFILSLLASLKINRVWIPPPRDFSKINIFVASPEAPLENGNENRVGLIMRDPNRFLIRGLMGLERNLNLLQVQLWSIHRGMKEAYTRGLNNVLVETEHVKSFRNLRHQNFVEASRKGLVAPIQAINACNPLIPSNNEPVCRIHIVSVPRESSD